MTISIGDTLVSRVDLLHVPSSGRWTFELAYPGTVIPSGKLTVKWGSATLVGSVDPNHVGVINNEVQVKLVGAIGWSNELPATWYQSDNPGLRGRTVATRAAEAVGETLLASIGTDKPSENVFRPLRVSYSRAKQTGAQVLQDVMANGQTWWVDFDGTTRAGVRAAPSLLPRVVLLDYDAGSKWADIECDDPSNLINVTIPADPLRGFPALVINELFAWTTEEGFRYRVATSPAPIAERSRFSEAFRTLVRGFVPELPALELRRARAIGQTVDGRISLQQVDRAGEISDFGRTEGAVRLYSGSPGVSATLNTDDQPEVVLAFSRADWGDPFAFLAAPLGYPGHVPFVVLHEASREIRFVGASSGVVHVGAAPTSAVALAPKLVSYLEALEEWATQTDVFIAALAAAVPFPVPVPPAPYPDAIADRIAAAADIPNIPATLLRAK